MSKNIKLNKEIGIDLPKLIDSKLLVQANSGGGKSWMLRRLLEQSHGKVQQIVIDLEGEFSTLREQYDYILVAKDGDTDVQCKSAALLAHRLLELNVSAIIDLYELPVHERKRFVKLFLDSLINAPKKLWHPCLIVLDEAHIFCPEKGQSEASDAVINLCSMGRKRGYCAILATQRLSKLHKDAAAECNNKLIGRTGLDIDRKRASEELGFTSKEQNLSLRDLDAGEFYVFGPAISREVIKVKVGGVKTTHPKAGARFKTKVTPPTDKIKSIIGKLSDLPEEAQKQATTVKELKNEIAVLKRHRCPKVEIDQKAVDVAVQKAVNARDREWKSKLELWEDFGVKVQKVSSSLAKIILPEDAKLSEIKVDNSTVVARASKEVERSTYPSLEENEKPLTGGALRMVKVLASRHPMRMSKVQLATFSRLKSSSGTYGTYMSALRKGGYFEEEGGLLIASARTLEEFGGSEESPQTTEEVIEMWRDVLKGGARRMFDILVEASPHSLTKEDLAEQAGLSHASGTFGTYLSTLRSNSLVEVNGSEIKLSENIYDV